MDGIGCGRGPREPGQRAFGAERAGAGAGRAAAPPPRLPARRQTPPLGDGPWDVQSQDAKLHVEVVTKGLDHPWGMAFLPDGGDPRDRAARAGCA